MAELQVHGGRAVVRAVLDALGRVPGCRMAEAGEFARRAFHNGKVDLAEAEGLADLIDAETEAQRRQALAQARGGLSQLYEGWRAGMIEAQALVEAAIDFADEPDVESDTIARAAGAGGRWLWRSVSTWRMGTEGKSCATASGLFWRARRMQGSLASQRVGQAGCGDRF